MIDDSELMRRFAHDRSQGAFRLLVDRHLNLVYSASLRRVGGDAHLACDVSQQVFIALARQAHALQGCRVLAAWLYTATRNIAAQVVRSERRRKTREREAVLMNESSAPDPDWERLRPLIDGAMDRLNESDRLALLLRFFEGKTLAQVGNAMNVSEDAARKRVDRALDRLRILLSRMGLTSSVSAVGAVLEAKAVVSAPVELSAAIAHAAASSSVASAGGLFHFMTSTKVAMAACSIGVVLAVGLATQEFQTRHTARVRLMALVDENAAMEVDLASLRHQAELLQSRQVGVRNVAPIGLSQLASEVPEGAPAHTVRDPAKTGRELIESYPEILALLGSNTRTSKADAYGLLFRQLGLNSNQIERFLDLVEQSPTYARWNTAKQAPIGEIGTGSLSRETVSEQLHELLGAQNYQAYLEFDRLASARSLVAQLGGSVFRTSEPLTADQAIRLTRIVAESSAPYLAGKAVTTGTIDWDQILLSGQEFLSGFQMAVLSSMQENAGLQQAIRSASEQARLAASQKLPRPKRVIPGAK